MSPLELIRQGVQDKNWNLVAEGYKAMTGQDVIAKDGVVEIDFKPVPRRDSVTTATAIRSSKSVRASGKNKFVDDGDLAQEDLEWDKTHPPVRRVTPRRNAISMVDVTCRYCGKTEQISNEERASKKVEGEYMAHVCVNCIHERRHSG